MSGAVVQSPTFIVVRRVAGSVSFYTNVFYFGWYSALLSGMAMFAFQKPVIPECGATRWFLIGVGKKYIICGLMQQDSRKKKGRQNVCVWNKRDSAIICVFCRDLHLTLLCSDPLQKDLCEGIESEVSLIYFFKHNYYHAFLTLFAFFFPLSPYCISVLKYESKIDRYLYFERRLSLSVFIRIKLDLYNNRTRKVRELSKTVKRIHSRDHWITSKMYERERWFFYRLTRKASLARNAFWITHP